LRRCRSDPRSWPRPIRERAERFNDFRSQGVGYLHIQATRPATLGYSLNDSPVGQLAWVVDRVSASTDPAKQLPEDASTATSC
jgi:hypothetical protein